METTFNFSKHNMEYIYSLHPKSEIILHIKQKNNSIASLYFTNQLNEKIDIPCDFIVYKNKKIQYPNETNDYTLYWSKNYDIVYNGETLYNIRNERKWTIYN
jgi:hypothetical protein